MCGFRLNQEIDDFVKFIEPSEDEELMRQVTMQRLSKVVKRLWSDAVVLCFGSFETKLYLPCSDIDLVVMCKCTQPLEALMKLSQALVDEGLSQRSKIEVITTARVPLVKYVDKLTGYPMDVSFNNNSGPIAAKFIKERLSDKTIGSALKAIVLIIKQFLYQRRLEKVYFGGLGGYAVFLMALSFLKVHPKIQLSLINPSDNIGTLLLEFLELYGTRLNTMDLAISFIGDGKSMYVRKDSLDLAKIPKRAGICIVDPVNKENDIGGGTFVWPTIKREFSRAHRLFNAIIGKIHENTYMASKSDISPNANKITTILGMAVVFDREDIAKRKDTRSRWSKITKMYGNRDSLGHIDFLKIGDIESARPDRTSSSTSKLSPETVLYKKIKRNNPRRGGRIQ